MRMGGIVLSGLPWPFSLGWIIPQWRRIVQRSPRNDVVYISVGTIWALRLRLSMVQVATLEVKLTVIDAQPEEPTISCITTVV